MPSSPQREPSPMFARRRFSFYPDWWINANLELLEEREKLIIPNFPAAEIVASRIRCNC